MDKLNLNVIIYPFVALMSIYGIILKKERKIYAYIVSILTILSIIRFDTGYDYYWYYAVSKYQYMHHPRIQSIYKDLEPGIQKIIDIARYYKHPQYFFAITALLTFILIYYTIYRDSKSPIISILFFLFLEMGFFRSNELVMQYCALAISFFALRFSYDKKYIKYILLILIAGICFHNSALLCLIFIFIPRSRIKFYLWLIYAILCILFFGKALPILTKIIMPQYIYLFSFASKNIYGLKDIKMAIILVILLVILDTKIKIPFFKITKEQKYIVYQKNIFLTGTILTFVLAILYKGHIPFRVGIYFMIYYLIIVGEYISYFSIKIKNKIKIFIILFMNIWFINNLRIRNEIILDKKLEYNENGKLIKRPNSVGFRIFINKSEQDMYRYLPNQRRGRWK
ncbi:MAG: EpsG family protein [Cetobacterium sp.]|uniref:EpsG family protein n=1 Tax=Cetobacterium sp. TaxID=2071632 RepID=UPI003F386612